MSLREIPQGRHFLRGCARSARWKPLGKVLRPPQSMRAWLLERDSLTQRLKNHYGSINVQVLQQQVGNANSDEGLHFVSPVIYRNVVLSSRDQTPLVVAHSIMPLSPRGPLSIMLKRLGRQALGSVLFTRPGFARFQREWALLDKRDPLCQLVCASIGKVVPQRLWARRAIFRSLKSAAQTVQVTEVFCMPYTKK